MLTSLEIICYLGPQFPHFVIKGLQILGTIKGPEFNHYVVKEPPVSHRVIKGPSFLLRYQGGPIFPSYHQGALNFPIALSKEPQFLHCVIKGMHHNWIIDECTELQYENAIISMCVRVCVCGGGGRRVKK